MVRRSRKAARTLTSRKNCERRRSSTGGKMCGDQLRKGVTLELFHDARLVYSDDARTDLELPGDLAVLRRGGEQRQYLALAGGEPRKPRVDTQYRRT